LTGDDPIVLVPSLDGSRLGREEGYQELPAREALWHFDARERLPSLGIRQFVSECRLTRSALRETKDWQVVDMVRQAIKDHRLVALRKGEDYGRNQDLPGDTGRIEARRCLLSLQASQGWRRVAQGLCRSRFLES
jgi:hypothetical protein